MDTYTIVETRQVRSLNPASATGLDTLVTYTDGAQRLHTITISGPSPTLEQIKAEIATQHAQRMEHAGKSFEA